METSEVIINMFTEEKRKEWDDYVMTLPNSTFFHFIGWKSVLKKTFGYKSYYLFAKKNGKICGILPLFLTRNLFLKKALVSFPFAIYGGVCADDENIMALLIEEAKRITKEEGAAYLELRNKVKLQNGMPSKDLYATFIKELSKNPDECLDALPRKARAAARKGIDSGLRAEVGLHLLMDFYNVYAISVKNLGSPVFSFEYLENLVEEFGDKTTVLSVKFRNKTIASVFSFMFKDTVMPYYGGSLHQYFKYQPNNFMYLKLMEWAVSNGYKYFDFGRSKKGTGSYKFKELQGFEPKPLYYQYWLNTLKEIPDTSSLNPKVQFVSSVWKKMPVWATKLVGPKVIGLTPP